MPTIKKTKRGFKIQHTTREIWGVDDPSEKLPPYAKILREARRAVKEEYENPMHGRLAGYDNQSVLVDVLNSFPAQDADAAEDFKESIRSAVRQAEQEFNEAHNVEL